jgi:hypothetical protein
LIFLRDLSPALALIEKGVPVKWDDREDNSIYVKGCPLTTPPEAIVRKGNTAILNYFKEIQRERGADYLLNYTVTSQNTWATKEDSMKKIFIFFLKKINAIKRRYLTI